MKYCLTCNLFIFSFIFIACSQVAPDQRAILLQTKGLTCDAVLTNSGELLICGETASYARPDSKASGLKDAYLFQTSTTGKNTALTTYAIDGKSVRFEQICPNGGDRFISGNYGEDKNKIICKLGSKNELVWALGSTIYKTIDKGDLAVDLAGNCLIPTKDPSSDAYEACLHLIDASGVCKWSRKLKAIEVWQDVIVLNNQKFMISYKQKGAYINGELRKKYWINTFQIVDPIGELVQYRNFHFEYDLITDWHFNKLLQDKKGNLYFIGKIEYRNSNRQEAFIIKTAIDGQIIWSHTYAANNGNEYAFKNACLTSSGNLIVLGDGYSKKGGIFFLEMNPEGNINWAKLKSAAYFDQAMTIISKGKNYEIIWDKLLNLSAFSCNEKGQTCTDDVQEIQFAQKNFPVLLNENKGAWENITGDWTTITLKSENHTQLSVEEVCK